MYRHTQEAKEKIRAYRLGKKGYKHTSEAKEKMRLAKLGKKRKPVTQETRIKMRLAKLGKRYTNGQKEKRLARSLLNTAIVRKKVTKKPCEVCGNTKSEAHHNDYYQPLKVKWLCKEHHHLLHKNRKYVTI